MRVWAGFLALLISAPFCCPTFADNVNKYWLLYEQGNTAADQKEFGKALQLYKAAIEGAGIFPEAEEAIGDVYVEESELALAQKQYQKAYDLRKSFYIPDQQYDILYKLANLFEVQRKYKQMEDELTQIVNDDKHFRDTPNQRLLTQVVKNYKDNGIDRVFVLYNFDDTFAAAAHSKLGLFYYQTGRYWEQSVPHLLYAVVYRVSQVQRVLKERDVDYEYSNLSALLAAIDLDPDLKAYAISTGLFADFYYLAGSTYKTLPLRAQDIWKSLSMVQAAGKFKDLSAGQLKKPFLEPVPSINH
jgi:tetratricopeptide (TPR) repeat protein